MKRFEIEAGFRQGSGVGQRQRVNSLAGHVIEWTPHNITTKAWYDASDPSTIAEAGGVVSQWNDKSGNGYHLSAISNPKTGITFINGLNSIDMVFQEYFENTSFDFNVSSSGFDYIFVAKHYTSYQYCAFSRMSGSTSYFYTKINGLNNLNNRIRNNSGTDKQFFGSHDIESNTSHLFSSTYFDSRFYGYINGTLDGSNGVVNLPITFTKIELGAYQDGNTSISLCEWVLLPEKNDATRQKIEGYLAWKWGLASDLDPAHPYKNSKPTVTL